MDYKAKNLLQGAIDGQRKLALTLLELADHPSGEMIDEVIFQAEEQLRVLDLAKDVWGELTPMIGADISLMFWRFDREDVVYILDMYKRLKANPDASNNLLRDLPFRQIVREMCQVHRQKAKLHQEYLDKAV